MAARSARAPARWRRPFVAWLDGIEHGWAIPVLIVAFAALWFGFFVIAYLSTDLHADVLEAWSVGRTFAWGNAKHPPLMGWVAHLWSLVFPLTDWSFQLLAMTNAAVALWAVDLIARRFVRGDKRAIVLLLLMLLPAYQFHAQRFNANTVLLAVWPLATYCFLRSFESLRPGWAIAAGGMAALAMLGKYYSIFLVVSLGLAAICHPQRRRYFGSSAPWLSAFGGLVVLAPHMYWLATTGAMPFGYAMTDVGFGFGRSVSEAGMFLLGLAATLAIPAICWVLMAGTRLKRFTLKRFLADVGSLEPGLWLLFLTLAGTIVLPVIVTIALGTKMPSLWDLQGLFLVAVVVVCGSRFPVDRFYTVNLAAGVALFAIVAVVVAAPLHALYRNAWAPTDRSFYRLAAAELTQRWHEASNTPLSAVSGEDALAFAAAFYSPDHPVYRRPFEFQYTWGIPRPSTLSEGWAGICVASDPKCAHWMTKIARIAPGASRSVFTVRPSLWGHPAARSETIVALIVPPSKGEPDIHGEPRRPPADDLSASRRRH